jgi:outer membrane protein assembly factor BamD (BamD/ComL family)
VKDCLSLHEYEVGVFYFKQRWYPGAIDRLKGLLKSDPGFTTRDGAYYYLAEALVKLRLNAEALPYYEKLIAEFEKSEFLEKAKLRADELKAPSNAAPAATSATKSPQAATATKATAQTPAPKK